MAKGLFSPALQRRRANHLRQEAIEPNASIDTVSTIDRSAKLSNQHTSLNVVNMSHCESSTLLEQEQRNDATDLSPTKSSPSSSLSQLLNSNNEEYITPIYFEDGMDWMECETYYTAIYEGMIDLRSVLHRRKRNSIRKPSKRQLQQQARGMLPSCLSSSQQYSNNSNNTNTLKKTRPSMRRSVSFHGTSSSTNCQLYASYLAETMQEDALLFPKPNVNFDDYVSVTTIAPYQEYPLDVQKALWMSEDETQQCLKNAMLERTKLALTSMSSSPTSKQQKRPSLEFREQNSANKTHRCEL